MTIIYSTQATAIGGRSGSAASIDGALRIVLARPRKLGGCGRAGTNPEQLFAAAHSASFLEAIRAAAECEGIGLRADSNVTAKVLLASAPGGAWQLEVVLAPDLPELPETKLAQILRSAALRCPYTIALAGKAKLSIEAL